MGGFISTYKHFNILLINDLNELNKDLEDEVLTKHPSFYVYSWISFIALCILSLVDVELFWQMLNVVNST